jgi:hypothetical protein
MMRVFKTDKKTFWINELKSWLWDIAFAALLYLGCKYFTALTNDNIIIVAFVILLIKLGDTLTQYHVREIRIDKQQQQMTTVLHSPMSGEKIKQYDLSQVASALSNNSGLAKYLSSPFTLHIFLNPKNTLKLTNRYGFTLATLQSVDAALKWRET